MGNYATIADLKGRYESDLAIAYLTDEEESGTPTDARLDEVIDGAEGEINSYLSLRYAIPVDVSSDTGLAAHLKSMTLDLAVIRLQTRGDKISEAKQLARSDVRQWLTDVSTGRAKLAATAAPAAQTEDPIARAGTAGTSDASAREWTKETQSQL